jgi:hypothetical protein
MAKVLLVALHMLTTRAIHNVVEVNVADGSIRPLTSQRWKATGASPGYKTATGWSSRQLSRVRIDVSTLVYGLRSGQANRISRDLQDYHGASVTSDAKTLITKQTETQSGLWIAANNNA